jgi:hypothetical protein
MSDRHIINCHLHLFTLDNVPEDFPSPIVGKLRHRPRLISFLAKMLKGVAPQIERLARMADVGRLETQEKVLRRVLPHYPDEHSLSFYLWILRRGAAVKRRLGCESNMISWRSCAELKNMPTD